MWERAYSTFIQDYKSCYGLKISEHVFEGNEMED